MLNKVYTSPKCDICPLAEDILTDSDVVVDGSWLDEDEESEEE